MIGAAPSAAAAQQLTDGAGIEATSVDRLLAKLDRGKIQLDDHHVILCDEAAMLGSRRLARLVAHVDQAGGKLVAIGDAKQLPAVDAGGLYAAVGRRCGYVMLTENRRQKDPQERQALIDLRAGRASQAVDRMEANGQIVSANNADRLRDLMVNEWATLRAEGLDVAMQARSNHARNDLNERARALLRADGQLQDVVAVIDDICDVSLTLADEGLSKEVGYSAFTRGRIANRVFVVRVEREQNHGLDIPEPEPLELLKTALARSQAKTAAIDTVGRGIEM